MRLCSAKQMRMPVAHSRPHHRRMGAAKHADSFDRQKERWDLHSCQCLPQPHFLAGLDCTEETERQMHLLRRQPSYSLYPGIKRRKSFLAACGHLQADE